MREFRPNFRVNAALGAAVLAGFCAGWGASAPKLAVTQQSPKADYGVKVREEEDLVNQMLELDPFDDGGCQDDAAMGVLTAALEDRPDRYSSKMSSSVSAF